MALKDQYVHGVSEGIVPADSVGFGVAENSEDPENTSLFMGMQVGPLTFTTYHTPDELRGLGQRLIEVADQYEAERGGSPEAQA